MFLWFLISSDIFWCAVQFSVQLSVSFHVLISSFKNFKKHSANPRLSVRSLARECASGEQEGWKSVCNSHAPWQLQEVWPLFWEFTGWAYLSHRLQHGNHSKISYRLANLVGCQDKDWIHMWVAGMEYDLHASPLWLWIQHLYVKTGLCPDSVCLFAHFVASLIRSLEIL